MQLLMEIASHGGGLKFTVDSDTANDLEVSRKQFRRQMVLFSKISQGPGWKDRSPNGLCKVMNRLPSGLVLDALFLWINLGYINGLGVPGQILRCVRL